MRWWWQSPVPPEELVRELRAIADAGFGEVEIAFSPSFWASETQRHALGVVLDEAERLGIGVASTLGASWPLQTPNTSRGTANASKELQYGVAYLTDPTIETVTIPHPLDDPDRQRGGELLAVTIARVIDRSPGATVTTVQDPWRGTRQEVRGPATATVLQAASLADVTSEVREGMLAWDGRDGDWAVFAFWMRDTEQGVTSFLDRHAAVAATDYIDTHQIGAENDGRLARVGTDLFEDSLELNADSLFWSVDLVERFRSRHGYDPTRYLPVLFAHGMCRYWVPNDEPGPDFELDTGVGTRIRQDYYRLLTDLYINDHLLVLQDWAVGHGLRHKAQVAYGQNLEPVRSNREFVRRGGRAEGESLNSGDRAPMNPEHRTWRYALDWQRAIVGGAHQGGTVRVSTELGAQFDAAYSLTLGDLKQMLDKEWAAGITKPFIHGYASQEPGTAWPTQSRFFDYVADSWNHTQFPEWAHWRPLTDYWARGTVVLETGVPRTDIAVYREGYLTTAARGSEEADATAPGHLVNAEPLEHTGYTIQFLDPIGLVEAGAGVRNGQLFPDGPAYRAVILDERAIPPDAAEALDTAAARGLAVVIVGEPPTCDSGLGAPDGDARVQRAITRLLGRPTVRRVASLDTAPAALEDLGVRPRVALNGPLLTQWRDAQTSKYLLVYNTQRSPVLGTIALEGEGTIRELDLWTGEYRCVGAACAGGRTEITISLDPLDLRVYELRTSTTKPAPDQATYAERPREVGPQRADATLGDWTLEVTTEEPGGARTIHLEGQGPADWRTISELRGVSGTGVYRVQVKDSAGHNSAISLGQLAGSATVRLNGRVLGVAYVSDTIIRTEEGVHAGDVLEIEVRTPLRNAVVAAGTRPGAGTATQAHGLVGPVRILT